MSKLSATLLGNCCEIVMGQAPPGDAYNDKSVGYPLIAGAGDFDGTRPAPKKWTSVAPKLSRTGDIILGIRASIGEKIWADRTYCLGRGVAALRAKAAVDPAFVWHWLTSQKDELSHRGRGATFKQISARDIYTLPIVLPSLPEQRRIAAILDQADSLRANRRTALACLDEMTQAIFIEMFGDPLHNPLRWPLQPLGVVAQVITGNTPSREEVDNYGGAIEWLKSDNLNTQHYYATSALEGLSATGRKLGRIAPSGAVLITCIAGSPNSIGNAAMIDREAAFNQQINALVTRVCNSHFLYAHVRFGKALIQAASTGAMKGMVSKSRLEQVMFMIPPKPLQDQFATRVMKLERLVSNTSEALSLADSLFVSLQHRAFTGAL